MFLDIQIVTCRMGYVWIRRKGSVIEAAGGGSGLMNGFQVGDIKEGKENVAKRGKTRFYLTM